MGSVKVWKQQNEIKMLEWPPQSSDLSPIENAWTKLKYELGKTTMKARNKDELIKMVIKIWNGISQEYIKNLYESMPKRCKQCIIKKGNFTKY